MYILASMAMVFVIFYHQRLKKIPILALSHITSMHGYNQAKPSLDIIVTYIEPDIVLLHEHWLIGYLIGLTQSVHIIIM
jgi:hypothetical protein